MQVLMIFSVFALVRVRSICLDGRVERIDDVLIKRAELQSLYSKPLAFVRDTFL